MAVSDQILAYLAKHPEGADDDDLALALGLSRRQQANNECRRLQQLGRIERRSVGGKMHNFLEGERSTAKTQSHRVTTDFNSEPWCWEGNVQSGCPCFIRKE